MNKKKLLILISLGFLWGIAAAQPQAELPQAADSTTAPAKLQQIADVLKKSNKMGGATAAEKPQAKQRIADAAFAEVIKQRLPLSPSQIASLYKAFSTARRAAATPPGVPPRPVTTSIVVNLSPDSTSAPPVIRLQGGYITTLTFVDSTGQPWPIQSYSIGDPSAFLAAQGTISNKEENNILPLQARSYFKRSNLYIHLKGLSTPIMLTLLTGQEAVDYRIDIRVPELGPNAVLEQEGLPGPVSPKLLNVLNGLPPAKNARALRVVGSLETKAWLLNDILYLRTPLILISPGWLSTMRSMDGTNTYSLQPASVLLALRRGHNNLIKLFLSNLKD